MSVSNQVRKARARAILFRYASPCNREDLECAIIDLLADLAHFSDGERFNLAQLINTARGHYNEETDGQGAAFTPPYCDHCNAHHVGGHKAPECIRARALDSAHQQYVDDARGAN